MAALDVAALDVISRSQLMQDLPPDGMQQLAPEVDVRINSACGVYFR